MCHRLCCIRCTFPGSARTGSPQSWAYTGHTPAPWSHGNMHTLGRWLPAPGGSHLGGMEGKCKVTLSHNCQHIVRTCSLKKKWILNKILFVVPPVTDPLKLPWPKIFYGCFKNNNLFYFFNEQKVKSCLNWSQNDSYLADRLLTENKIALKCKICITFARLFTYCLWIW